MFRMLRPTPKEGHELHDISASASKRAKSKEYWERGVPLNVNKLSGVKLFLRKYFSCCGCGTKCLKRNVYEKAFFYGREKLKKELEITNLLKTIRYLNIAMRYALPNKRIRNKIKMRARYMLIKNDIDAIMRSDTLRNTYLRSETMKKKNFEDFDDMSDGFHSDRSICSSDF
jgi:hypothetical protein